MSNKNIDEKTVYELYNKYVVKDSNYFQKFENIPTILTKEVLQAWKGRDVPRLCSLLDYSEWVNKYNLQSGECLLSTCAGDDELRWLSYKQIHYAPYPPHDLHTLSLEKKDYDFVIFNQTLEHLYNPYQAVSKLYEHIKPGGFLYTTVPTINIPHMVPIHYSGITPIGLCVMMHTSGFEICECGHWGNKKYIDYIFSNNKWPGWDEIVENNKLANDPVCQAQTWILVRKPHVTAS